MEYNKLVILDLNGILSNNYKIRKGSKEFIEKLLKDYVVAIWSSCQFKKVLNIVHKIGINEEKFLFIWNQKQCTVYKNPNKKLRYPLFSKDIKKVMKKYKLFDENDIVIVDDTLNKIMKNPHYIVPKTYYEEKSENIEKLLASIHIHFNLLYKIRVQKHKKI